VRVFFERYIELNECMYMCVCRDLCPRVCVYERERERDRERVSVCE